MQFLLCTLIPEVQCEEFHRNHVIWRTKITKFDGMELIRNNQIKNKSDDSVFPYTNYIQLTVQCNWTSGLTVNIIIPIPRWPGLSNMADINTYLQIFVISYCKLFPCHLIRVITKLPNSEQSYKGKVKTHKYINGQNQSTTGKLWKPYWPWLGTGISKEMVVSAKPPPFITAQSFRLSL